MSHITSIFKNTTLILIMMTLGIIILIGQMMMTIIMTAGTLILMKIIMNISKIKRVKSKNLRMKMNLKMRMTM